MLAFLFGLAMLILVSVGWFRIFRKCGVSGWWSIVPYMNCYILGDVSGRTAAGVGMGLCGILSDVLSNILRSRVSERLSETFTLNLGNHLSWITALNGFELAPALTVAVAAAGICNLVFGLIVYNGLCEHFAMKKTWLIAWLLVPGIAAMIWGFSSEIYPQN